MSAGILVKVKSGKIDLFCHSKRAVDTYTRVHDCLLVDRFKGGHYFNSFQYASLIHGPRFLWQLLNITSSEPEGCYHCSMMFHWEPEGRYHHRLCTGIVPFWFSMQSHWIVILPFWPSTDATPWEPEGRYHHRLCTGIVPFLVLMQSHWIVIMPFWPSTDATPWEPEGRYHHRLCTGIVPFWFSMQSHWIVIMPFWPSTDDIISITIDSSLTLWLANCSSCERVMNQLSTAFIHSWFGSFFDELMSQSHTMTSSVNSRFLMDSRHNRKLVIKLIYVEHILVRALLTQNGYTT